MPCSSESDYFITLKESALMPRPEAALLASNCVRWHESPASLRGASQCEFVLHRAVALWRPTVLHPLNTVRRDWPVCDNLYLRDTVVAQDTYPVIMTL